MTMNARIRIGVVGAVALAIAGCAIALAKPQGMAPRAALVSAHSLTVRSTVGSYCVTSPPRHGTASGQCADGGSPLPVHGHLPVGPGDTVRLRFRHNPHILDRVSSVHVGLVRVQGHEATSVGRAGRPVQNPQHPSRWSVQLPENLKHANVLDIFVRLSGGDADFWAGIAATL
jgi:hypothetical protein